jgi:hypothetical protein
MRIQDIKLHVVLQAVLAFPASVVAASPFLFLAFAARLEVGFARVAA